MKRGTLSTENCDTNVSDKSNSIETAIAIAFFGTIAIGIAIAKTIFQLLLLLLILLREFSNYCYSPLPNRSNVTFILLFGKKLVLRPY